MAQVRKLWDRLVSPFKQVDKRQLQHEIDIHRLFLLTTYNRLKPPISEAAVDDIESLASTTSFADQQSQIQNNIHQQISSLAVFLDSILLTKPRPKTSPPGPKKWQSGLSFAVGAPLPQSRPEIVETHPLSRAEISSAVNKRLGFSLECKQSGIDHEEAGEGLFLRGRAEPGTVVSFYPGVIYSPSQYRCMPGYPRVDEDNPYLISRYDGLILDGKPWGSGGEGRVWWNGSNVDGGDVCRGTADESDKVSKGNEGNVGRGDESGKPVKENERAVGRGMRFVEYIAGAEKLPLTIRSAILERRNPLAFGHYANHPPQHVKPNVMICPYSLDAADEVIRPYIPNVVLSTVEEEMERRGILWVKEGRKVVSSEIRTLVLVAMRTLEDEELMLNYRLSAHLRTPPAWFHSVDEEEDQRRWE